MSCETGGIQKEPNDSWFFTDEQGKCIVLSPPNYVIECEDCKE